MRNIIPGIRGRTVTVAGRRIELVHYSESAGVWIPHLWEAYPAGHVTDREVEPINPDPMESRRELLEYLRSPEGIAMTEEVWPT